MSPERRARLWPWIALLLIYTVWGSTYMAIRVAVRELPPFATASLRFLVAGLVMGAIALVVDRRHGWPSARQWREYALIGVLLLAVGNALVMWAERTIPSGITALIVATVPLWILLFDGLRPGGEPWTLRVWLGTLVGLVGVACVARPAGQVSGAHWAGVIGLTVASLGWTAGTLYSQSRPQKLPLFSASAIEMLAGALVLALESWVFQEPWHAFRHASPEAWWAWGYLAVFGSLVGFTAFAYCLNTLPATTVGTYAYVNPVVAVALGAVFLDEPLSKGVLLGGALILAAVVMTTLRPRRPAAADTDASTRNHTGLPPTSVPDEPMLAAQRK